MDAYSTFDLVLIYGTIGVLVLMPIIVLVWAMTRMGNAPPADSGDQAA